jgi:DNA-binding NtrC family response regulator
MSRILIVDDERDIREILQDLLEDLGEVVGVENGVMALDLMRKSTFDLVISDFNMPAMNGMQLLKQMNESNIRTPMIWITGRSTKDLIVDAWKEGVFDYIEKPFDLEQVRKSVITALALESSAGTRGGPVGGSSVDIGLSLDRSLFEKARGEAARSGLSVESYLSKLLNEALRGLDTHL